MPRYRITRNTKLSGFLRHRPSSRCRCYGNCAAGSKPI